MVLMLSLVIVRVVMNIDVCVVDTNDAVVGSKISVDVDVVVHVLVTFGLFHWSYICYGVCCRFWYCRW